MSAKRRWMAGAAVLALALAACGGATASQPGASGSAPPASAAASSPAQPTTVRLASKGSPSEAAFTLAIERGYFAKQGLRIEPVALDSGPQMVPALSTDQVQAGAGSMSATLFNALTRGVNIRMVADFSRAGSPEDASLALMVRKDLVDSGEVKTLADLKGRPVGLGTAHGTASDYLWAHALQKAGLTSLEIEPEYLQFPDIFSALANRRLAAGTLIEPLVTQAVQKGIAKVFYPAGAVMPGAELSILQFSPKFAAEQPDAATRFMIGYLQGVRDHYEAFHLGKDKEAAVDVLVQHLSLKDRHVWEAASPTFADLNGQINVDDLKSQARFYNQQGTLTNGIPDIDKFVDSRFAEAAVRQLGKR